MKKMTISIPGGELTLIARRYYSGMRNSEWNAAPRLYVNVNTGADFDVMESLMNRKRRPYNIYKTMIHSSGLKDVISLDKLSWSQHAGCTMCPCSPGFILNHQSVMIDGESHYKWDAWLTLTGAPTVDESKLPRAI